MTHFQDAAYILRQFRERVERDKESDSASGPVNIFRGATDKTLGKDTVTTATQSSGSWTWGTSEWDHDEWG